MKGSRSLAFVGIAMLAGCGSNPATAPTPAVDVDKQRESALQSLKSEDHVVRGFAVAWLANQGAEAKAYLPELKKLENDPQPNVRDAVKEAIKKIEKGG